MRSPRGEGERTRRIERSGSASRCGSFGTFRGRRHPNAGDWVDDRRQRVKPVRVVHARYRVAPCRWRTPGRMNRKDVCEHQQSARGLGCRRHTDRALARPHADPPAPHVPRHFTHARTGVSPAQLVDMHSLALTWPAQAIANKPSGVQPENVERLAVFGRGEQVGPVGREGEMGDRQASWMWAIGGSRLIRSRNVRLCRR